jgi:hypothetical protein
LRQEHQARVLEAERERLRREEDKPPEPSETTLKFLNTLDPELKQNALRRLRLVEPKEAG